MWDLSKNSGGADYRASLISRSPEETERFAEKFAGLLNPGDLILAFGDLGAGKTCFSRGLARGLDVTGEVASPSFTYVREYYPKQEGGLAFYHFDAYRLHFSEEWYELGFDEYLDKGGICLIEWPERVLDSLPAEYIRLNLDPGSNDEERIISVELPANASLAKREQLRELVSEFK